jgi:hypothetical protein
VTVSVFYDELENNSGFSVGVFPEGIGYTASTDQLQKVFGSQ